MLKKILITLLIIFLFGGQSYALEGLIKKVDLNKKAVMVKNNWYFLQKNTYIERNGNIGTLKSCFPLTEDCYQWGHLVFDSDGSLEKLIVEYNVIEGIVENVDYIDKNLRLNTYKGPETNKDFYNFSWTQDCMKGDKIQCLKPGQHIILISGGKNILRIID